MISKAPYTALATTIRLGMITKYIFFSSGRHHKLFIDCLSFAFEEGKFTTSDFKKRRKKENTNQPGYQFTMFINHFYNLTATSTVQ